MIRKLGKTLLIAVTLLAVTFPLWTAFRAEAVTYEWEGDDDGDFNSSGNWNTNGVQSKQAPPTASDVLFNYGSVDVDVGLDQSAKDFTSVTVGQDYSGDLGTSTTNPLKFGTTKLVVDGGGSLMYIAAATANIDEAIITLTGPNNGGDLYLLGTNTVVLLVVSKGDVYLHNGTFTTVHLEALNNQATVANLTNANATITTLYKRYGTYTQTGASAVVTSLYHDIGTSTITDGTVTNAYQRGGTVYWNTDETLAVLDVFAGTFDASDDYTAKTITAVNVHDGGTVDVDNGVGNITLTTAKRYKGSIATPAGTPVAY